jgi:hypothetical protein
VPALNALQFIYFAGVTLPCDVEEHLNAASTIRCVPLKKRWP